MFICIIIKISSISILVFHVYSFNYIKINSTCEGRDIIASITVSLIGFVESFTSAVIVFICNIIIRLTSHRRIICRNRVTALIHVLIISLILIKGKMSKLQINIYPNIYKLKLRCI